MNEKNIKRMKKLFDGYTSQKERAKELENKIEEVFHRLSGIKAITYDNIPGTANMQEKEYQRLDLIEQKAELEKELAFVNEYIKRVDSILKAMPFQDIILFEMKYLKKKSYESIAYELHYYDGSAVYRKMEAILKKM